MQVVAKVGKAEVHEVGLITIIKTSGKMSHGRVVWVASSPNRCNQQVWDTMRVVKIFLESTSLALLSAFKKQFLAPLSFILDNLVMGDANADLGL